MYDLIRKHKNNITAHEEKKLLKVDMNVITEQ